MKHFRVLLPFLILALVLSGCESTPQEPYKTNYRTVFGSYEFIVDPGNGTITCGTDVYTYQVEATRVRTTYIIDYPNGAIYHWMSSETGGAGGGSENYDESRYIPGDVLVHSLELNQPREKTGNIGIGLLLIGLGALNFFIPEIPFYLRYGWAVRDAEPSDAYITWMKIGGVIAAVAGLVYCII